MVSGGRGRKGGGLFVAFFAVKRLVVWIKLARRAAACHMHRLRPFCLQANDRRRSRGKNERTPENHDKKRAAKERQGKKNQRVAQDQVQVLIAFTRAWNSGEWR